MIYKQPSIYKMGESGGGSGGDENILVVDVFINSYSSTITGGNKTYAEIKAAFDEGKFVIVRTQDTRFSPKFDPYADTEIYVLDYYDNESDIFEFVCSGMTFHNIPSASDPVYGNNKQINFSKKLLTLWKRNSQGETQDTWRLYTVTQQPPQVYFFNFEIIETGDNVWQSIDAQYYQLLRLAYEQGQLIRFKITRYNGTIIYDPQVSFTEHTIHLTITSGFTNVSHKVVDIAEDGTVSTHTS